MDTLTLPVPDKKRRRASWFAPIQRFWMRNPDGGIVRWLNVDRYDEYGNERTFSLRIPANDQRPRGLEYMPARKGFSEKMRRQKVQWILSFGLFQWTEIVGDDAPVKKNGPILLLAETSTVTRGTA